MSRILDVRPSWRAALLLSLACLLVATVTAPPAARAAQPQEQARQQEQAQQRDPDQNPDSRGGRAENPADDDHSDGTTLILSPSRLEIAAGHTLRLSLTVLGAQDLRRLPVTIRFNPDVLKFVSVNVGSAWTDRRPPILLHDSSRPGELVIGLAQLDKNAAGIFGSGELLELEFVAIGPGSADLVLERFAAIGPGSSAQPVSALASEIVVR